MSAQPSLAELAQDFFVLGAQIEAGTLQLPDADSLRQTVLGMFETYKKRCEAAGKAPVDVQDCTYALAAHLDEVAQTSRWHEAHNWALQPLQRIMFSENVAGENFYHRLKAVRQRSLEATEVYYLCLVLGFEGVYALPNYRHLAHEREDRIEDLRRDLGRGAKKRVSAHGLPPDAGTGRASNFPLVPVGFFAMVLAVVLAGTLLAVVTYYRGSAATTISAIAGG